MASNPMQRKARNSFLLGVILTLLIAIIAGALFYILVFKEKMEVQGTTGAVAYVYKLKEGIELKSGDKITSEMVEEVKITANVVPTDAVFSQYKQDDTLVPVPFPTTYKCKIALKAGTILGKSMLYTDDLTDNSLRLVEFNMISLQSTAIVGEYIDVRLFMPTGEDYIILSKKCVMSVKDTTIGLLLNEEEINTMSAAIIDAYTTSSGFIYATKYIEPGMQTKATQTYAPKQSIIELMRDNPNIVDEAKRALTERWNTTGAKVRTEIEKTLNTYIMDGTDSANVQEKMKEQKKKAKELYLKGLEGY